MYECDRVLFIVSFSERYREKLGVPGYRSHLPLFK